MLHIHLQDDLLKMLFVRAPIGQAYGLTETFAGGAFSDADDLTVGRVGPPLPCCYIKVCSYLLMKYDRNSTVICKEDY